MTFKKKKIVQPFLSSLPTPLPAPSLLPSPTPPSPTPTTPSVKEQFGPLIGNNLNKKKNN